MAPPVSSSSEKVSLRAIESSCWDSEGQEAGVDDWTTGKLDDREAMGCYRASFTRSIWHCCCWIQAIAKPLCAAV